MPFGYPDTFTASEPKQDGFQTSSSWTLPVNPDVEAPNFENDEGSKKLFGIELAKGHSNVFEAALAVFPEDTRSALWISSNWLNDPVVIAARDIYLKTVDEKATLLDKDQLAATVLKFATEKHPGTERYYVDAKERLDALKFYSDLQGYTGKNVNVINNNNIVPREMRITFVNAEHKEPLTLGKTDYRDTTEEDFEPLALNIRRVSASAE